MFQFGSFEDFNLGKSIRLPQNETLYLHSTVKYLGQKIMSLQNSNCRVIFVESYDTYYIIRYRFFCRSNVNIEAILFFIINITMHRPFYSDQIQPM